MRRTVIVGVTCAHPQTCVRALHGCSGALCRAGCGALSLSSAASRSAASRVHRTLSLRHQNVACAAQTHWNCTRALFGGWKAAKVTAEDAVPDSVTSPEVSTHVTEAPAANAAATAATTEEVKQLRQQVEDLKEALEASQEAVKQLLMLTSVQKKSSAAAIARSIPSQPGGGVAEAAADTHGASYVVRTSEELVDALRGRGSEQASRTIILDGKLFLLDLYGKVEVDQARVSIVGNSATVIGHISVKGRGAVLTASDVFFLCPYDLELRPRDSGSGGDHNGSNETATVTTLGQTSVNATGKKPTENAADLTPVISATAGAGLHLDRCVLSNGRDGVYLGMGSHCTLNHVRIVNCIRGLYEGVGCRTSMVDGCTFQANRYHMVLLGPGGAKRASRLFQQLGGSTAHATAFTATFSPTATVADVLSPRVTTTSVVAVQQTKAQVVLQHNPITDIYEDCWIDGQPVKLAEADATAGLSDPLF